MRTCVVYELPWSQRFFLPLRGSGSLISCRVKSRKSSGTGVLTSGGDRGAEARIRKIRGRERKGREAGVLRGREVGEKCEMLIILI